MTRTKADTSNSADILDSRDIIARIAELEDERDNYQPDTVDGIPEDEEVTALSDAARVLAWTEANENDAEELRALLALQDEAEGYAPDWQHGACLISDHYFENYARDMAEDIHGRAIRDASWPFDCIDWEQAAEALQQDYTAVEYGDVTYWVR